MFELLTAFLAIFAFFLMVFKRKKCLHLPPGPRGLPLVGNLFQTASTDNHKQLSEWTKVYGKFYTIHLAQRPTLIINDSKILKELFCMLPATGRQSNDMLPLVAGGKYGVGLSDGKIWQEQREFLLRSLKQFGICRASFVEPLVLTHVSEAMTWIEHEQNSNGKCYISPISRIFQQTLRNIGWEISTGEKLSNPDIAHLINGWKDNLETVASSGVIFFTWVRHIAPILSGYQGFKTFCWDLQIHVHNLFNEHKKTRIVGSPARDLIDAYIDKVESCTDIQSSFYGDEGWKHSYGSMIAVPLGIDDAFGVAMTLVVYYLTIFSTAQKKLEEEINKVIGNSRDPSLRDKKEMPYMKAVILETLRFASAQELGVAHELTDNVVFHGYQLPKGMMIVPNLRHLHYDKQIWGDPETFRPDRFLESDSKNLKSHVMAFQPGKRSCPGESFAMDVMFLILTKLFQKYSFLIDPTVQNFNEYLNLQKRRFISIPRNLPIVVRQKFL